MRDAIARLRSTFVTESNAEDRDERPATALYECSACRSLIINPSGERCSQCESGTVLRR